MTTESLIRKLEAAKSRLHFWSDNDFRTYAPNVPIDRCIAIVRQHEARADATDDYQRGFADASRMRDAAIRKDAVPESASVKVHPSPDTLSGSSLADYNNDNLLWKWAKHVLEKLDWAEQGGKIPVVRDALREFQKVCQLVPDLPSEIPLMNTTKVYDVLKKHFRQVDLEYAYSHGLMDDLRLVLPVREVVKEKHLSPERETELAEARAAITAHVPAYLKQEH